MSSLTSQINKQNVNTVRAEIHKKNSSDPYFANSQTVAPVVTDFDHHPYTRWYRNVYYYPNPIVIEREAGYRPIENTCYDLNIPPQEEQMPRNCWQNACSTTLPCIPPTRAKGIHDFVNDMCIVQYR